MNKKTIIMMVVGVLVATAGSVMAVPPPPSVPDVGSSGLLLGSALVSLVGIRAFLCRK